MNQYEVTFIVDPVLSNDEIESTSKAYQDLVADDGCTIVNVDRLGLKQLAYPINKRSSGVYYCVEFKGESGAIIPKMELALRRDERIMRFLTVSLDRYGIQYNEDKRAGKIGTVKKDKKDDKKDTGNSRNKSRSKSSEKAAPAAAKPAVAATPAVEKAAVAAAPIVEAPAPVVETPAVVATPVVETPAVETPVVEAPAVVPAVEAAVPVVETPAPAVVAAPVVAAVAAISEEE